MVALVACGRIGFDATTDAAATAMRPVDELNGAGSFNDDPALRDDELEIVWTSDFGPSNCDIFTAKRSSTSERFGPASIAVSSPDCDSGGALSVDGLVLWFASTTPAWSVYESTRTTTSVPWPTGVNLAALNTGGESQAPTVTADGLLMIFQSDRAGNYDLYASTRATATDPWSAPARIDELATPAMERSPHVSPDGTTLWFVTDAIGNGDIVVSSRSTRGDRFGAPVPIDAVNSNIEEDDPWVSADGKRMYLSRRDASGTATVWIATF